MIERFFSKFKKMKIKNPYIMDTQFPSVSRFQNDFLINILIWNFKDAIVETIYVTLLKKNTNTKLTNLFQLVDPGNLLYGFQHE